MSQKRKISTDSSSSDSETDDTPKKLKLEKDSSQKNLTSTDKECTSDASDPAQPVGKTGGDITASKNKKEEYVFFFGINSPFSQFHPAKFEIDGVHYSCAEQYMMHQKAVVFGDKEMAKQIMNANDPKKMKAFGRKVTNFDPKVWGEKSKEVVKKGNIAKFSQNKHLQKELFETHTKTLVEASPRDRLWGIGLGAKNPKALKKENWRGKNLLGYSLTEVRDNLMKKGGLDE